MGNNFKFSSPILKTIQKEMKSLIFAILLTSMVACRSEMKKSRRMGGDSAPTHAGSDALPDFGTLSDEKCGKCGPTFKDRCKAFVRGCLTSAATTGATAGGAAGGAALGACIAGPPGAAVGAPIGGCVGGATMTGCIAACQVSEPQPRSPRRR